MCASRERERERERERKRRCQICVLVWVIINGSGWNSRRCILDPGSSGRESDPQPVPSSYCSISINADTINMENASSIVAGKVNITCSTLNIAMKAKIDTTAGSLYKPPKPVSFEFNAIGGSHGGYGKSCWDKKIEVHATVNIANVCTVSG